jgi:hypothetical protein
VDYPSKAVGLYAGIEWGLRDIKFLSPFIFSSNMGTFYVQVSTHFETKVLINDYTSSVDYYVLIIKNKDGDNAVLMKHEDISSHRNESVDFKWIAKHLKKKWRVDFSPQSTTAT